MPTILITGANRGIGARFVNEYLKAGWQVVAGVRDPATMKVQDKVIVVKIDSSSLTDPKDAVAELKSKHGVKALDVVIANAGVASDTRGMKDLDIDEWQRAMEINTRGPLLLFQAVYELLPKGTGKFVVISSGHGQIQQKHRYGDAVYGHTKAAVNYMIAKIHTEEPDVITLALSPGWVATDMGIKSALRVSGRAETDDDINLTVPGMVKVIAEAQKDTTSGTFRKWHGGQMAW